MLARVSRLPPFRQQEVLDFITFLEQRYGQSAVQATDHEDWPEEQYKAMSVDQTMRGLTDEPDLYSESDLN
ncbi:DUF2281 domain-containing protein [Modicisalibacter ilicicola]|uniref:DUF2281 domain-containing protein n=1 Tax=Modicisalibacter ilicicola TaxID=480814 RepID=UPI00352FF6CB